MQLRPPAPSSKGTGRPEARGHLPPCARWLAGWRVDCSALSRRGLCGLQAARIAALCERFVKEEQRARERERERTPAPAGRGRDSRGRAGQPGGPASSSTWAQPQQPPQRQATVLLGGEGEEAGQAAAVAVAVVDDRGEAGGEAGAEVDGGEAGGNGGGSEHLQGEEARALAQAQVQAQAQAREGDKLQAVAGKDGYVPADDGCLMSLIQRHHSPRVPRHPRGRASS